MDAAPPRQRPRPPSPDTAVEVLDSIPTDLLNAILSRLPLRDAVRTSALARAWRRRWQGVPSLKFEWDGSANPGAVTGVLRRYSHPVREFHHSEVGEASFRHSDRWLRLLVLKGVQNLLLSFTREGLVHTLHPSIFSCRELTVLVLGGCDVPATPPGFAGLPNLAVLRLSFVGFQEGVRELELLIATSPLLKWLYLSMLRFAYSDNGNDQWVIQAPKLRWFSLSDIFYHGWKIGELPSLELAHIGCPFDTDFVKNMAGLARVRDLNMQIQIGDDNILEGLSCPFNDLKRLTLNTSLSLLSSVLSVFCLLRNAPKLEHLYIEINDNYSQHDEVDFEFLNAQWTGDLLYKLRRVSVISLMCKLSEMNFIKFVLSKARQLEEFRVCLHEDCSKSNEAAVTELVKYRRDSPRAKVVFRPCYEQLIISLWSK